MFKTTLMAALLLGAPALAEVNSKPSDKSVEETMTDLMAAVTGAGATVFAVVDHAAGGAEAGFEMEPAQLLIFGNPKLGSQAIIDDPRAGLVLPLRVEVLSVDGVTQVVWADTATLFDGLSIAADAPYRAQIDSALDKLTDAAVAKN